MCEPTARNMKLSWQNELICRKGVLCVIVSKRRRFVFFSTLATALCKDVLCKDELGESMMVIIS